MKKILSFYNYNNRTRGIIFTIVVILFVMTARTITPVFADSDNYFENAAGELLNDFFEKMGLPTNNDEEDEENTNDTPTPSPGDNEDAEGQIQDEEQAEYTKKEVEKIENKIKTINNLVETFEPLYDLFYMVGYIFMIINLMTVIIKDFTRNPESVNMETWTRFYIVLAVTGFILGNLDVIIKSLNGMGEYLISISKDEIVAIATGIQMGTFSGEYAASIGSAAEFYDLHTNLTVVEILTSILNCTCDGVIYSIGIRMIMRRMFLPIAVSDMAIEGARSPGFKYMVRYLSYYLQISIIYIAMVGFIFIYAIAVNNPDLTSSLWANVATKGAMAGIIAGSGAIANEVLGVE